MAENKDDVNKGGPAANDPIPPVADPLAPTVGADPEAEGEKLMWVVGTAPAGSGGGYPLALFERDVSHPDGEAYVTGPAAVLVAPTSAVMAKIQSGEIRKANSGEVSKAKAAAKRAEDDAARAAGEIR